MRTIERQTPVDCIHRRAYQKEDEYSGASSTGTRWVAESGKEDGQEEGTDLCALGVLETLLEEIYGGLDVEVEDKVGAAGEDAEGGLTGEDVGAVCHGENLGAECVPWVATF